MQGAHGGTLRIGDPIVEDDQYVFPIFLREDSGNVAALDFRFQFDPQVFEFVGVTAGIVALQANKQVLGRLRDAGEFGILVMGLNDLSIRDGEVVRIAFTRSESVGLNSTQLAVTNVTFSDGEGAEIPTGETTRSVALVNPQERTDSVKPGEGRESKEDESPSKRPTVSAGLQDEETSTTEIFQFIGLGEDEFATLGGQPDKHSLQGAIREALRARAVEAERIRNKIPTPIGRLDDDEVVLVGGQGNEVPVIAQAKTEPGTEKQDIESVSTRDTSQVDEKIESYSNRAIDSPRAAPTPREAEPSQTDSAPSAVVLLVIALAAITVAALFAARGKLFG